MKTTTISVKHSLNRASYQLGLLLIPLALACFVLSPHARATCQQGCLTNDNTVLGDGALISDTTGGDNTATGNSALQLNTTGGGNTANGSKALEFNTTGSFNTANGSFALLNNTTGSNNTATGYNALVTNTIGTENTATGFYALFANTAGGANTADGRSALGANTTGSGNTAIGFVALGNNTIGNDNAAMGHHALGINTSGSNNTATGALALLLNTTGSTNTASGSNALVSNTTGNDNTAIGVSALYFNTIGINNTAIGVNALVNNDGSDNIGVGDNAGSNLLRGSNNIYIGNHGRGSESRTIRVGAKQIHRATFIAGVSGATVADGVGVIVGADGHLGTIVSSAHFKEAIKPMDKASEAILALKPVTFRYKQDLDPEGIPQFGLVAEDVEKVNPDLVARDEQGKPYTVRYAAVNAMLLNEFLKEHHKVEAQEKKIGELEATLKEQAVQLQRVAAQLQANLPARLVVSAGE